MTVRNSSGKRWDSCLHLCAYGVSLLTRNHLIRIGGNNEERLREMPVIQFAKQQGWLIEALPSLPQPMDNFAGAIEDSKVYVYSDREAWELDLENANAGWKPILQRNETRVQPWEAADGQFCVWGGYSPKSATAHATLNMDGFACTPSGSSPLSTRNGRRKGFFSAVRHPSIWELTAFWL